MRRFVFALLALFGCDREFVVLAPNDQAPAGDAGAASDASGTDGDAGAVTPEVVRSVSAHAHTCAVDELGVACWGDRQQGQFGALGGGSAPRPVRMIAGEFVMSCNGEEHACALRADGTAFCWGANRSGQCAAADRTPQAQPNQVPNLRFTAIACGGFITCGITNEAELYCWGDNHEGTLGQGDANLRDSDVPLRVARELRVRTVSIGQAHLCLIDQAGALSCWGRNTELQAGGPAELIQLRTPRLVEPARAYEAVAAAQNHTCAVAAGAIYCWGAGERYAPTAMDANTRTPVAIGQERDYQSIAANWFHTCALKRSGALFCWGRNEEFQLGLGDDKAVRSAPTQVTANTDFRAVAVGQFHTCAVRTSGLFCWGDNRQGQLGVGTLGGEHQVPERVVLRSAVSSP